MMGDTNRMIYLLVTITKTYIRFTFVNFFALFKIGLEQLIIDFQFDLLTSA